MTVADPASYAWLFEELEWFSVAGCVTVAPGTTPQQLAAAFGADLSAPQPRANGDPDDEQMLVSFTDASDEPAYQAVALAMVETYTGVRVTAADVEQALTQGYAVSI